MVRSAHAGILPQDAKAARTWELFSLWATLLQSDGEDRTALYKQRELREGLMKSQPEDPTAMFQQLELTVTTRLAEPPDLRRVADLINRTNQFNTTGFRTSNKEVMAWHSGAEPGAKYRIYVIDAEDKFGPMGTICILIAKVTKRSISIPAFVLSCRVFGYGIEFAILAELQEFARHHSLPIEASYVETPHNAPCKDVYPKGGFTQNATGIWTFQPNQKPVAVPIWLKQLGSSPTAYVFTG